MTHRARKARPEKRVREMWSDLLNGPLWRTSSRVPGQPICKCSKGWGSKFDGLCTSCRGCTAWEAQRCS